MKYVAKTLEQTLSVTGIVNLHFFEFGKDFSTEGERHPFYELVFVNSGKLYISSEDYTGYLKKHEMLIHRANSEHSLKCDSDSAPSVIIIGFACDSDMINLFSGGPFPLDDEKVKKLAEIVKEGRNVFMPPYNIPVYDMRKRKKQAFGSEQLLRLLLEYFLIGLIREYGYGEGGEDNGSTPSAIQEIIHYVNGNYIEKITIDELAFLFNTNRSAFCRRFRALTGSTFVEYIADKKIAHIKKLLSETEKSVSEISNELNFESVAYLCRFFKKHTGQTPKGYRQSRIREA